MDKILLFDGHNAMWRANIAFKSKGRNKSDYVMVYNFFKNLRATIEEFKPNKIFFCLEGKDNFRYRIFSDYKANRFVKVGSKDERVLQEFNRQKRIILDLLPSLPITTVKSENYECDDVIATLAENLKDEEVIIISNDSDFIQLLQKGYENLKIYNPFKKEFLKAPEYHYLVWKCLAGDKRTDNIPGMVGPKTAEKLVSDPDELQEFLSSEENRANFNLNRELIELKIIDDDELEFSEYETNFDLIKEEFVRMEFNSILDKYSWDRFCNTFKDLR